MAEISLEGRRDGEDVILSAPERSGCEESASTGVETIQIPASSKPTEEAEIDHKSPQNASIEDSTLLETNESDKIDSISTSNDQIAVNAEYGPAEQSLQNEEGDSENPTKGSISETVPEEVTSETNVTNFPIENAPVESAAENSVEKESQPEVPGQTEASVQDHAEKDLEEGNPENAGSGDASLNAVSRLLSKPETEDLQHFSDDEIAIDVDGDSSSSSESESDSEDSDSSDSDSEPNPQSPDVENADLDEDEEAIDGPIISKNEVEEKAHALPEDYKVSESAPLELVGEVTGLVERSVIVKANISGEFRVLKDNSVLCFEDRTLLGPLFETFGRLQAPVYRVKFNSDEEFDVFKARKGHKVYYVVPDSQFLYTDTIKSLKGTDASNCHDEELPEEEQEFSDDEQELAAKQGKKKKKKAKKTDDKEPNPKKRPNVASYNHPKRQDTHYQPYGYSQPPPIQQTFQNAAHQPSQSSPYGVPIQNQGLYSQPNQMPAAYGVPFNLQAHYQQPYGQNQAPQQFSQAPQPYNQAPQAYNQPPQAYNQAPQAYNQPPQPYNQTPQAYNQSPYPVTQQPYGQPYHQPYHQPGQSFQHVYNPQVPNLQPNASNLQPNQQRSPQAAQENPSPQSSASQATLQQLQQLVASNLTQHPPYNP